MEMRFFETVHANERAGAALVCLAVLIWILLKIHRDRAQQMKLPPGPPSLPVIGNLHMWGRIPPRSLRDLSRKYGPLMLMRLGCVPTVVASSADMAKEILKTYDHVFASRPPMSAVKNMLYDSTDLALAPYGPYWKQMRKICVLQLFSPKRIESFQPIRAEEVSLMINSILGECHKGSNPVNVSKAVSALATDTICRTAFGKKYDVAGLDSRGSKALIEEYLALVGAFDIGDFIPYLRWADLQGLHRRQRKMHNLLDAFFDKLIEEHEMQNGAQKDLVDVLLAIRRDANTEIEITRDNIKAVVHDMLAAGTDTTAVALEWGMSLLLKNPTVMKKVQEELEKVVGLNRMVEESDLPHLEYLRAVVKETFRLYPPTPLLLPRESMESCTVSGYYIPAKSRVVVNAWAIGRDPGAWEDAETYKPERFLGSPIDVKGHNFELIPFGSGRRICPGMRMGTILVEFALAQLLHCFDWKLPVGMNAEDLDMREEFLLGMPRAVNLLAVPTPRLSLLCYR